MGFGAPYNPLLTLSIFQSPGRGKASPRSEVRRHKSSDKWRVTWDKRHSRAKGRRAGGSRNGPRRHGAVRRRTDARRYKRNICSRRASISSSSMNSPRSAWATPSRTAARNRTSSSSRRKAASFTSRWATVPSLLAICASFASCSGEKCPSSLSRYRKGSFQASAPLSLFAEPHNVPPLTPHHNPIRLSVLLL